MRIRRLYVEIGGGRRPRRHRARRRRRQFLMRMRRRPPRRRRHPVLYHRRHRHRDVRTAGGLRRETLRADRRRHRNIIRIYDGMGVGVLMHRRPQLRVVPVTLMHRHLVVHCGRGVLVLLDLVLHLLVLIRTR